MAHRVCLTGIGLAMLVAGCAVPHRAALGGAGPPPSTPASTAARPGGLSGSVTTTSPTTDAVTDHGPTAIAARFTAAYFTSEPGDNPSARRQRCRPFDTDALDQLLGLPTWNGAANDPAPNQSATITIDTMTLADRPGPGSDGPGAGYELTVTVTAVAAGQVLRIDHRDVQLWLTSPSSDVWRVDQVSVT
jgi:hypothetical protein